MTVTISDCLRNVMRRTGRAIPTSADDIAKPLTDDELAALIGKLHTILVKRLTRRLAA